MARGGLYDHLGGGFHRYSVDARWCVPHFEKMLYDQGQLPAHLHRGVAAQRRRRPALADPRDRAVPAPRDEGPDGGFYASQDADSEGEEGRFYVWTPEQVAAVLGDAAESSAPPTR
jgi:uncharacterized protein YyaL (SSP411 family)